MPSVRVARLAFNRGIISRLGLARADIQRTAFAAQTQTNWICRVLGSMSLRPGLGYLGTTRSDNVAIYLPFVFSISDKALIELTALVMRIWISDAPISRPSVTTATANGNFTTNLTSWTDADEAGGVSQWTDGHTGGNFSFTGGYMGLAGNGTAAAIRLQQVTVIGADQNVEHALRIVIANGPVVLRVGSTSGGDEYINETALGKGTHSLAFTPTGDFFVQFQNRLKRQVLVDSCNVEASGIVEIDTPWVEADLDMVRGGEGSTSGDQIYIACDGYQQRIIERRATRSWSVVVDEPEDGPFLVDNIGPITLTPGGLSGNILINSSAALFRTSHVGALFRIISDGQRVTTTVTAQNQFTNAIRVTGVGSTRVFTLIIDEDAAGAATFTLQRSLTSDTGPWGDVSPQYTADTTTTIDDGLDNQIAWYRLGVKTGDYVNGNHPVELNYPVGSITGVVRITAFVSVTSVDAEVITDLGAITASDTWAEGQWSTLRGFPTAVTFHEGRLNWDGRDKINLSVSDGFDSFDDTIEGDSAPISRSIGSGPVDRIAWALSLQRLLIGGEGTVFSVRASSLDEILTPTNFNIRPASSQGSAQVQAVKVDQNGAFVQNGGVRVYELEFGQDGIDYNSSDLTALVPEIGRPGITKIVVQRQPDTRLHCIRSDGTVAMLVFDKLEQVAAWLEIETDGTIVDAVVLPGDAGVEEDRVYYEVARSINGSTKRHLEKWALESECKPVDGQTALQVAKLADSFITYSQAASSTITVGHLIGESVVVWDNGICLTDSSGNIATFTVSGGGTITVTHNGSAYLATVGMVGLAYRADWKSAKLVELMQDPNGSLNDTQIIRAISLILADTHPKGLLYGSELNTTDERKMSQLPRMGEEGQPLDADTILSEHVVEKIAFPGFYSKNSRLCLIAQAPRPCTVLAAIADVEHYG